MAEQNATEWLSLHEAARLLGVHPATLRAWSDKGRIAARRTPGGHRRFKRADLEAWASQRQHEPEVALLVQSALGRIRMEMGRSETGNAAWMTHFDEPMRQRYRETGRQLLGLLLRYISSPDRRAETLSQARELGREYALISREHGLTLADSVQAVLFFHNSLTSSVVQMASAVSPASSVDWASTHREVTEFVNDVLLAMVKAYMDEASA
jgi:excisionase family DNA binding protein